MTLPVPADFDPVAYINEPRWRSSVYGLERIEFLLDALGNPQRRMRIVHVAGTNGKGSTCAYTDAILRQAGFRVGLFTSPYIIEFTDRIRIDGVNVGAEALLRATLAVRDVAEGMDDHPTEFELMTAVAFACFAEAGVDFAVLEVGLGGRLDSTNVVEAPEVCAIVPIDFDHTDLLGDTLAAIAAEKAGIVKRGATVVMGVQQPEADAVVRARAAECGCAVREVDAQALAGAEAGAGAATGAEAGVAASAPFAMQRFSYGRFDGLQTQLLGSYQPQNAACAIEIALALRDRGFDVGDDAIRAGVSAATWPGRFQVVAQRPTFVVDGGHNPQGAAALAASMDLVFPGTRAVMLVGVLGDKDFRPMLRTVLPYAREVVCTQPPNPRQLPADELAQVVGECAPDLPAHVQPDIAAAVAHARQLAGEDGLVVAFGSLYSIASIMDALKHDDAIE